MKDVAQENKELSSCQCLTQAGSGPAAERYQRSPGCPWLQEPLWRGKMSGEGTHHEGQGHRCPGW